MPESMGPFWHAETCPDRATGKLTEHCNCETRERVEQMMSSGLTIWKFPIFNGSTPTAEVEMPEGAEILTMQTDMSGGTATIWVRVNPSAQTVVRRFEHVGTGQEMPPDGTYLGTWQRQSQQIDGSWQNFVFHVFEVP